MAMLCWATYAGTPQKRIVGLCHSVQNTTEQLAELVGVPLDEITFLGAGVNHQAFILRFERDGEDLYPRLDEAIERDPELLRRVRVQMYRRLGYFPTESSEHSAEYLPWLMRDDEAIERYRLWVAEYVARSEENLAEYERTRELLAAGEPLELEPSNEYAPQIIHSIETGTPAGDLRQRPQHRPDRRTFRRTPASRCPCLVDGAGVQPTWVGALPPQLAALNRTFLNVAELTVRAALEGRPEYVRQAVMLDPNAAASLSLDAIWELCDELTAAHGDALPEALRVPVQQHEQGGVDRVETDESVRGAAGAGGRDLARRLRRRRRRERRAPPPSRRRAGRDRVLARPDAGAGGRCCRQMIDDFNRTHPDVVVSKDSGGVNSDRMLQKVTAGLQADNYPDIAYIYGSDLANLAERRPAGRPAATRSTTARSTGTASSTPARRR